MQEGMMSISNKGGYGAPPRLQGAPPSGSVKAF